jgi:hypothetical protein
MEFCAVVGEVEPQPDLGGPRALSGLSGLSELSGLSGLSGLG